MWFHYTLDKKGYHYRLRHVPCWFSGFHIQYREAFFIPFLQRYTRLQKNSNNSIFGSDRNKVSCKGAQVLWLRKHQWLFAYFSFENMTPVLVSWTLSPRITFSVKKSDPKVMNVCSLVAVISLLSKLFHRRKIFLNARSVRSFVLISWCLVFSLMFTVIQTAQ